MCIDEYIVMYNHKRHLYDYLKWSIVLIFNKYLNPLRNLRTNTVVFKNKKFQFFIETTNSRSRSPNLHGYYCVFNNVRLFNSRYTNYDPYEHEFKNENCVSRSNENSRCNIIGCEMKKSLVNRSKIKIGLNHRNSGRNIHGASRNSRNINRKKIITKNSFAILFNS